MFQTLKEFLERTLGDDAEEIIRSVERDEPRRESASQADPHPLAHYDDLITQAVSHYEQTAPTVSEWCDSVYRRLNSNPDDVRVSELYALESLARDGWMHPNYAANYVYKLQSRLGQDVTGQAGF